MRDSWRGKLTYANVMATVAVFVALGGGAYATHAHKIATNDLKGGAVTTPKLKQKAVRTPKIADNAVKARTIATPLKLQRNLGGELGEQKPVLSAINTHGGANGGQIGFYAEARCNSGCIHSQGFPDNPAGMLGRGLGQAFGVAGAAGNLDELWRPVGPVGVAGLGQSRGVYGSGGSSYGIYATSLDWYGLYGRTSRPDNNYGLYTPDNLFANSVTSSSMATVMQNDGADPLEAGDVVAFSGMGAAPNVGSDPVPAVVRASAPADPTVAGVVVSRFDPDAAGRPADRAGTASDPTPAGSANRGSYVLVTVAGPARVNVVSGDARRFEPGERVVSAARAGQAMALADAGRAGAPGAVLGKALGAAGKDQAWAFVNAR